MNSEEALRFVEDELENKDVLQADIALGLQKMEVIRMRIMPMKI
jgi:ABC-type phosphate transport system permease subunit